MEIGARAIGRDKYTPRRQFLSGFIEGYDVSTSFHVQLQLGSQFFVSSREYEGPEQARKAAHRLAKKLVAIAADDTLPTPPADIASGEIG